MWIKKSLIIVPIALLTFLAISFFFAPSNEAVAENESRQDRIILYMGGNPENMNPWTSTATTDTNVSGYFFEGLLRYDRMYEVAPWLARTVVVTHEVDAVVPEGMTGEQFEAKIREKYGKKISSIEYGTLNFRLDKKALKALKVAPTLEALKRLKVTLSKFEIVTVTFSAPSIEGEIVSAVVPKFEEEMKEFLEGQTAANLFVSAAKSEVDIFSGLSEKEKNGLTVEKYTKMLEAEIKRLGGVAVGHRPVVEFNLRKGVYWTDGPYFSAKERTWLVSVNGDETGILVKDSADEAIAEVRKKMDLAKDVDVAAINYEKTFDGEDGAWWGRGPEFTARDPKITFEHIKDPLYASPRRSAFLSIEDIRVFDGDPHRMQVVYKELYSPALSDLTGAILPYHRWNDSSWTWEAIQSDLGWTDLEIPREKYNPMAAMRTKDRMFRLKPSYLGSMVLEPLNGKEVPQWENNLKVRLRRNEFYWGRKTEYRFVDWYIFDPKYGVETSEMVFQTGGMDIYSAKNYQVERYEKMDEKYYVIKRQPTQYEYLGFNMSRGIMKDRKVRLALSMAIDVEKIIKYVVYDQGERVSGPAYPVLPWYNHGFTFEHKWRTGSKKGEIEKLKYVPFNLDEARALLAEAGYTMQGGVLKKDGKPLKIQFVNTTGEGTRQNVAELARANWATLGAMIDYKTYEWNDYIQRFIMAKNFDICVLGWSGGLDFDKRSLWHTDFQPPNGLNFCAYSNPDADKLMEDILKVYDPKTQIEMSHQLFDEIASDFPYVFLYSPYSTTVVDRHIVWRKEVGKDKNGNPIYEDRPLTDEYINKSRASWRFFEPEIIRRDKIQNFK